MATGGFLLSQLSMINDCEPDDAQRGEREPTDDEGNSFLDVAAAHCSEKEKIIFGKLNENYIRTNERERTNARWESHKSKFVFDETFFSLNQHVFSQLLFLYEMALFLADSSSVD